MPKVHDSIASFYELRILTLFSLIVLCLVLSTTSYGQCVDELDLSGGVLATSTTCPPGTAGTVITDDVTATGNFTCCASVLITAQASRVGGTIEAGDGLVVIVDGVEIGASRVEWPNGTNTAGATLSLSYTLNNADIGSVIGVRNYLENTPGTDCGEESQLTDADFVGTAQSGIPTISGNPGNQVLNTPAGICFASGSWDFVISDTDSDNISVSVTPSSIVTVTPSSASQGSTFSVGGAFPEGTTTVVVTATDNCTGSVDATSTFDVTVTDNVLPALTMGATCPTDQSALVADAGVCTTQASWTNPAIDDNCAVLSAVISFTDADGAGVGFDPALPADITINNAGGGVSSAVFETGTTIATLTVTDENGNTATSLCSWSFTVTDGQDPTITCPSAIAANTSDDATGDCTVDVSIPDVTIDTDNCGDAMITYEIRNEGTAAADPADVTGSGQPGTLSFPEGANVLTYIVTDASSNSATCDVAVTVTDDEDPIITGCPTADVELGTNADGDDDDNCGL